MAVIRALSRNQDRKLYVGIVACKCSISCVWQTPSDLQFRNGFHLASTISSSLMNCPSIHRSCSLISSTFCLQRLMKVSWQHDVRDGMGRWWVEDQSCLNSNLYGSMVYNDSFSGDPALSWELCSHSFITFWRPPFAISFHSSMICWGTKRVPSQRGVSTLRRAFISVESPLVRFA